MIDDLKIIKKNYGETMAHFCREEFPTILEQPGALSNILLSHFNPTRFLYKDICEQDKVDEFKNYIYDIFDGGIRELEEDKEIPTPEELLDKVGYTLYKCETEEDIQAFRKYYKPSEELCTFKDERLKKYYVFFAVKKNVSEIIRENFHKPERQDEYGTSVISIQFSRNESHLLSIKNRYNHHVAHPDATFSNNLDNIIEGLTDSFAIHYNLTQKHVSNFYLDGYVLANDGKYYKYNYEINNIYYCPNNIIIDNGVPAFFDKEKFIIMDYFILDLSAKRVNTLKNGVTDSFPDSIGKIKKITIQKDGTNKRIIITLEIGEDIIILLNDMNWIIEYINPNITTMGNRFLKFAKYLKRIEIKKSKIIGDSFCQNAVEIEEIELPEAKMIGSFFLAENYKLKRIYIPKVKIIHDDFCYQNDALEELDCPKLEKVGQNFIPNNIILRKFYAPKLKQVSFNFCYSNNGMKIIDFPSLEYIGSCFFERNRVVREIVMPNVESIFYCYFATHMEYKDIVISSDNNYAAIEQYEDVFVRIRDKKE